MATCYPTTRRPDFLILWLASALLLLASFIHTSQGFVLVPQRPAAAPRALRPQYAIRVSRVTNPAEAEGISEFFVSSFWDTPITKPRQREQLKSEVYRDLTARYISGAGKSGASSPAGSRMGAARGKSALLVAKEGGKVVGCGGLETRVIREGLVTKYEVVKRGDPPGTSLGPVLANLAVDRTLRRKGVGKKILMECERVVKGWGFQEVWLVVDEKNKPARALYEKNGYELMARDPRGMKVVPTEWQLKEMPVTNLCMRKDLRKGKGGGGAGLGEFFAGLLGGQR